MNCTEYVYTHSKRGLTNYTSIKRHCSIHGGQESSIQRRITNHNFKSGDISISDIHEGIVCTNESNLEVFAKVLDVS